MEKRGMVDQTEESKQDVDRDKREQIRLMS